MPYQIVANAIVYRPLSISCISSAKVLKKIELRKYFGRIRQVKTILFGKLGLL